jgi:hypothetical protein
MLPLLLLLVVVLALLPLPLLLPGGDTGHPARVDTRPPALQKPCSSYACAVTRGGLCLLPTRGALLAFAALMVSLPLPRPLPSLLPNSCRHRDLPPLLLLPCLLRAWRILAYASAVLGVSAGRVYLGGGWRVAEGTNKRGSDTR